MGVGSQHPAVEKELGVAQWPAALLEAVRASEKALNSL